MTPTTEPNTRAPARPSTAVVLSHHGFPPRDPATAEFCFSLRADYALLAVIDFYPATTNPERTAS